MVKHVTNVYYICLIKTSIFTAMLLKRKFLLLFVLSFPFYSIVSGQVKDTLNSIPLKAKKNYFQMGIGFNFASGIGTRRNYVENLDSSSSLEYSKGSYGKGFEISMSFGRMVTKNFGLEMGLGVIIGSKNKEENQYITNYNGIKGVDKQSFYFLAHTFKVNPKIVFEVPLKNDNAFYGKFGYVFGVGNGRGYAEENVTFTNGQKGEGSYEWRKRGGIVSGSSINLGFKIKTEVDSYFFIELTSNNLSRKFKHNSMIYSYENGQNTIDSRTVYSKETIYEDKVTTDPNAVVDPDQPKKLTAYLSSYNSCGFRIGFVANF